MKLSALLYTIILNTIVLLTINSPILAKLVGTYCNATKRDSQYKTTDWVRPDLPYLTSTSDIYHKGNNTCQYFELKDSDKGTNWSLTKKANGNYELTIRQKVVYTDAHGKKYYTPVGEPLNSQKTEQKSTVQDREITYTLITQEK